MNINDPSNTTPQSNDHHCESFVAPKKNIIQIKRNII